MPKSITFFSRGKTPIYVNYVIAHNNVGARSGKRVIQIPNGSPTSEPYKFCTIS